MFTISANMQRSSRGNANHFRSWLGDALRSGLAPFKEAALKLFRKRHFQIKLYLGWGLLSLRRISFDLVRIITENEASFVQVVWLGW